MFREPPTGGTSEDGPSSLPTARGGGSVRGTGHPYAVFIVRVACSGCPEETEVVVESINEVDAMFCDCDYGWVVLSVSEAALA